MSGTVYRIILSICVFFLFAGHPAAQAESAIVDGSAHCTTFAKDNPWFRDFCDFSIHLNGEIDSSTVNKVKVVFDRRRAWIEAKREKIEPGEDMGSLIIDSPGGNLAAAMAIGRILRKERVTLYISKGHECVSACVILLAGAVNRLYGGKVGIHRPYFDLSRGSQHFTPDEVRSSYQKMLQEMRAYLREMNVSERLADDMLAIGPADVRYLSYNELKDYGLMGTDPIEQETIDLQEAQHWGLDRREYMRRRKALLGSCGKADNLIALEACHDRVMKFGR